MRTLISCGVLPLLSCLTPVFAEEQPAAPKPAASASVASDDLLQAARARMQIEEQRLGEVVKEDVRKARLGSTKDPDGARKLLRDSLLRVLDNPDISERVRDDLLRKLVAARRKLGTQGAPPERAVPSPKTSPKVDSIGQDTGRVTGEAAPVRKGRAESPTAPTPDQEVAVLVEAYLALPAEAKIGIEGDRILGRLHMVQGKLSLRSKEAIARLEASQTLRALAQALRKNDQEALKNLVAKQSERETLAVRLKEAVLHLEPSLKRWEYKILAESYVEKLGEGELAAGPGQLGEEGWELVGFEKGRFVFKRQK